MVEKSQFLEQQTVLLFRSIYFVLYVHMRRMKGREEGCKGCPGCLSKSRALVCYLSVSDPQGLKYLSNIDTWLLWVKAIRFFLYSMQLPE